MSRTIWSARQMAAYDFQEHFVISPLLPDKGIALVHGKRGIGKTHLALTLGACISEGGVLFGRFPTEPSRVLIVQADMPAGLQQIRVRRALRYYSLDNVYFHLARSFNLALVRQDDKLVRLVERLQPRLIIWDTLRKIFRGSTNDDDMPSWLYGRTLELFPDSAHLFMHHDKKTIADQQQLEQEELFRGSGAWLDDADAGLHVVSTGSDRLTLYFTKHRAMREPSPIPLAIHPEVLLLYAQGDGRQLADAWRERNNPHGTPQDLYRFLMSSFACSPRVAAALTEEYAQSWKGARP